MNCICPFGCKHPVVLVNDATGFALTSIVCEIESTQLAELVNLYQIVCVPAPASEGEKLPAAFVPGP